jgi:hypothetical protein
LKLQDINSEDDLRTWLREQAPIIIDVEFQWVEPNMYGSTVGAGDLILKYRGVKIDLELKYLERSKRGTKFTVRPSQRRFHHMSMMKGGKTSLLWVENIRDQKRLFLLRGDHIPLRNYISDQESGQKEDRRWWVNDKADVIAISNLKQILFKDLMYWWIDLPARR